MAKFKNARKALRTRTVWRDFFMLSMFAMLFGAALTATISDGPMHQMKGAWGAQAIVSDIGVRSGSNARYEKRLSESMGEQGTKVEHPTPQQAWDKRAPTVPLKVGWLQPDDISPAAVFLASDAADMVTGAECEVTGGDSAKDI
jgi:hypothetical protein